MAGQHELLVLPCPWINAEVHIPSLRFLGASRVYECNDSLLVVGALFRNDTCLILHVVLDYRATVLAKIARVTVPRASEGCGGQLI